MTTLLYLGIIHSLFIILFLLSRRQKNSGDFIIICWMGFMGLPMLSDLVCPLGLDLSIPLLSNKLPYAFTFGPLLLLYTCHITGAKKWTRKHYILHFSPVVIGSIYKLIFVPELTFNPVFDLENSQLGNILSIGILVSSLGYSFVTLNCLNKHKIEVLEQFSFLSSAITLKWLKWLTICLVVTSIQPFIFILLSFPELLHTRIFSLLTLMFVLSFFSLNQLQVFCEVNTGDEGERAKSPNPRLNSSPIMKTSNERIDHESKSQENDQEQQKHKVKYENSSLTDEKAQNLLCLLKSHIEKERPYLDSDLTLDKLALQLDVSRHHLTQILSERVKKNFYLFINEYRIEAVKALMNDPYYQSMTLLNMAYHCGFNSKPTFNRVFKISCGVTPSQYRKSCSRQQSNVQSRVQEVLIKQEA